MKKQSLEELIHILGHKLAGVTNDPMLAVALHEASLPPGWRPSGFHTEEVMKEAGTTTPNDVRVAFMELYEAVAELRESQDALQEEAERLSRQEEATQKKLRASQFALAEEQKTVRRLIEGE